MDGYNRLKRGRPSDARAAILAFLNARTDLVSTQEIATHMKVTCKQAAARLNYMKQCGLVVPTHTNALSYVPVWRSTEAAREVEAARKETLQSKPMYSTLELMQRHSFFLLTGEYPNENVQG